MSDTLSTSSSNTAVSTITTKIRKPPVKKLPRGLHALPKRNTSFSTHGSISARSRSSVGTKHSQSTKGSGGFGIEYPAQVIVFDEQKKDVTPISLLSLKPSVLQQHTMFMNSTSAQDSPMSTRDSSDDFERNSSISIGQSFMSWSSRTSLSEGSSTPSTVDMDGTALHSVATSPRTVTADDSSSSLMPERGKSQATAHIITPIYEEKELLLNQIDSDKNVNLFIEETPTIWLLDIPGSCVEKDGPEFSQTIIQNQLYKQIIEKHKTQHENYMERGVQTLNNSMKTKEVQITPAKKKEIGVSATEWSIYDSFHIPDDDEQSQDQNGSKIVMSDLDKEPGTWIDIDPNIPSESGEKDTAKDLAVLKSSRMMESLRLAENMTIQNIFHKKHLRYRGVLSEKKGGVPSLSFLWSFNCNLTKGKRVSCMTWNTENKDILAVGYTDEASPYQAGLVLCWSLKNPTYPRKIISTTSGVSSVSFSVAHPNLLAAGQYDGSIAIYDVRQEVNCLLLDSNKTEFKHLDPVWAMQWVDRGGDERGEMLITVSTDGRVIQWSIKKGLEHTELMKLKRISNQTKTGRKNDAFISRQAGALCLDFHPKDNNIYMVGTEDGNIHKCSCSYNEQYLETYFGHSSSVYKVKWSPFYKSAFLSCSADWTIKLWDESTDAQTPCLTFESVNNFIGDLVWSPTHSTVFASITGNNAIEVWDLEASTLDPTIVHTVGTPLSCVLFAENCPVLVTGDSSGHVNAYRLSNFKTQSANTDETPENTLKRVMRESIRTML